jgi:2-polyprenyl-3-methyl-5-hydroxy-6-metoxy-1,4-benzoquinol methylase
VVPHCQRLRNLVFVGVALVLMDADLYEQLRRVEDDHWWFRSRRHIVKSLIARSMGHARPLRICDIGCGTGGNLVAFAENHEIFGVEKSVQGVEFARRRLGDRVTIGHLPDGIELPNESFDVVLLLDVLEHVESDAQSAKRAVELLRSGGIVVATVPANPWLYSQYDVRLHHFRRYSKSQFRQLWIGTKLELLSYYNALLFPPAATVRIANRLFPSRDATNDLEVPPALLNSVLRFVMKAETPFLGRVPVPFGLSLIAVARRQRD